MGRPARLQTADFAWCCARWAARISEVAGVYLPLEGDVTCSPAATFDLPDSGPSRATSNPAGMLRDAVRLGFRNWRRPFPLLWPHRRGAAALPTGAAAHGAQARPHPPADRRRRGHRQDGGSRPRSPANCSTAAKSNGWLCSARPIWPSSGRTNCGTKFHIDAELVLPSTVNRLGAQHRCRGTVALRHLPLSSWSQPTSSSPASYQRRVHATPARSCVIVDEAHTCAFCHRPAQRAPSAPPACCAGWPAGAARVICCS
jgi:hypothetical protein